MNDYDSTTRQSALIFPNIVAERHIFSGCAPKGSYDPQIRTRPRFLYSAPTPKFHHPVFTRSKVIVLTNKQTHTHTQTHKLADTDKNIQRASLRYDVGQKI